MPGPTPETLTAPLVVEFPFTRSLGPVQSAFLTGLRERTVLGVRTRDGRVLVPPVEYDPVTAEEIRDLVETAATGTVTTWAWNPAPRRGQPLATPFAWVLVRLDGADTALLHALDAPGPDAVHTGLRVRIRWAVRRTGAITDIACFEPYDSPAAPRATAHSGAFADPVTGITTSARLDYTYTPRPRPDPLPHRPRRAPHPRRALPRLPQGPRPAPRRLPHLRHPPPTNRPKSARAAPSPPSASSTSRPRGWRSTCPTSTPTSPSTAPTSPSTGASPASPTTGCAWACASSPYGPKAPATPTTTGPPASPTPPYDAYKELL
ncbi:hypothetical protein GCM10020000_71350 [Streptomyces olivoverticillatus]